MKKTPLQIIDSSLFLYGALVTFFLTITALFNLNSPGNLLALIIFLPVAIYFTFRSASSVKQFFQHILNLDHEKHTYFSDFSFSAFINQSDITFLINLVLLCFAISLILFRISLILVK